MPFDPKDPEAIAAIDAAVQAAVGPLIAKRDELLGEVKKLRAKSSDGVTPEALAAIEQERDKLQTELSDAKKAIKASEATAKQLEAERGFTTKLLVDNGLVSELTKHGVTNPVHIKAASALLRGGVQIVADGENRVAKVGEKALADFVKEWASGEEGKFFVSAPSNAGGGAPGSNGKPSGADLSKLPPAQRLAAAREAQTT